MNLQEMIAARAAKLNEMKALNEANATMDDAVKAQYEGLKAEFDKLNRDITLAQAEDELAAQTDAIISPAAASAIATADYRNGFDVYVAGGDNFADFKAAMTEGTDADGGYIVPESYQKQVMNKLHTLSSTRGISNVIGTESTKNIPIEGDAPTFDWIDEAGTYGQTKSTFGNKQLEAWKLGGIIKVSEELLGDNMINFDAYMSGQIAIGIDKAEAPAFCTGDGNKKPKGYMTGLTGGVTLATVDGITETEIVKIFYSLSEAYRKRATWRFNTKTLQKIRNIKDSNGLSIYKDEIKEGTIEGRPFVIDESMPDMAANAKAIVLGDFNFYQIGDRGAMSIQRLNEKYADEGMVGFKVRVRVDAKRMLDEAFVVATNAAA